MEKQVAINILEDIKQSLIGNNAKEKGLKAIERYRKNLKVTTNEKIRKLIKKQKEYHKKYGEFDKRTLKFNKKIDEELKKIYNS